MSDDDLRRQLAEAQETIRALQEDLAETNTGFIALTLEFEQRVDERMAELQEANRRLEQEIADRKRAEEALRQYTEQLEAVREVGLELTCLLDLDALLHSIVSRAMELVDGDSGGLYLYQPDQDVIEWTMKVGPHLAPVGSTLHRGEGLSGKVWETGEPLIVDDYQCWEGRAAMYEGYPFRAAMGVPVRWGEQFLGVLNVLADQPYIFSPADAKLLGLFATQAAIAIRNARLYDEAQGEIAERKQAEEALRASEEKHRTILENIEDGYYEVDLAGNLTFFNDSLCRLYGYSEDELMGMNNRQYMDDETAKIVYQTYNAVYRTRKPARAFDWELIRKDGTRSFVDVSVSLIRSSTGEPTGFRGVVRDVTERKRAEEEIRRHLQRIESLREIDRAITSTLDLTGVLDIILEELERLLPYHSAAVFLLSDGTARVAAARGHPDVARALEVSFPVQDDALISELGQKMHPLVLADAQADKRFLARGGTEYVRSWIGVPLIAGGTVGFLTLGHREPGVYDEESAEMAEAFGSQVAIAIENARLYEEAQRELTERKRAEEELRQSHANLQKAFEGTVNVLVSTIEMRDPYTAGHQRRVSQLACAIAKEMDLPVEKTEGLRMASLIHDIGKITIPAEILSKPSQLSDLQWGMIKSHPQIGYEILKTVEFPWPVAQIVLQHHERIDGSGYPQGLSDGDILIKARILAVADVVEAMSSHRPYRPARGIDKALEEIARNRGRLYDPEAVDACLKLFREDGFTLE